MMARKSSPTPHTGSQWVPIETLRPYPQNSRTHGDEQITQLRESLREFGWVKPALVLPDMTIIAGHGVWQAAKAEGLEHARVTVITGLTDRQVRAYVIADNKLALNSGWDPELLRAELLTLENEGVVASFLGFDDEEVTKILDGGMTVTKRKPAKRQGESFAFEVSAVQRSFIRLALNRAREAHGVMTDTDALVAIINDWTDVAD